MFTKIQSKRVHALLPGFTLVELIVVITILAILGTIGFISIQWYSSSARDSSRISNLVNLQKWLTLFQVAGGSYPMPENPIVMTASGTIIGYQGFAKNQVAGIAKLSADSTKDPLDPNIYTTYATNALQTKMQLMNFLEDGSKVTALETDFFWVSNSYASSTSSYASRSPVTRGDNVGILLGTGSTLNQPVQELLTASFTGVDVVNTSTGYTAVFSKDSTISGSGGILQVLSAITSTGKIPTSCKEYLNNSAWNLTGKDGTYQITTDGRWTLSVYCDMTTDGGGWTRLVRYPYMNTPNSPFTNFSSGSFYSIVQSIHQNQILAKDMMLRTESGKYGKCPVNTATIWTASSNGSISCLWNKVTTNDTEYTEDLETICLEWSWCKIGINKIVIAIKQDNPIHSAWNYGLVLWETQPLMVNIESNYILGHRWCGVTASPDVLIWMTGWDHHGCHARENTKFWGKATVNLKQWVEVADTELWLMLR